MSQQRKLPYVSPQSPVMGIFCEEEISLLTEKEKQYCYNFAQAAWEGAKICYFQKSYESPAIFIILQLIFSAQNQTLGQLKYDALKVLKQEEYQAIISYSAAFFNNAGNFKAFGSDKFIPEVSQEVFFKFIQVSSNYEPNKKIIDYLWNEVKDLMFSNEGKLAMMGFPPNEGQSGYYSQNITKDEIESVDDFLQILDINPINTRIIKQSKDYYQVCIASVTPSKQTKYYKGVRIDLIYGDYSPILRRVAQNLEEAIDFASNPVQKQMLKKYVEHFTTGNVDAHKDSQRLWVRDFGPIIETNIGFIESYLDPKQVRADFEGLVAIVNKRKSEITKQFVSQVPELLKLMPWPAGFEKDKFLKPDFTVLSVLSFGGSTTYLGINIPNYDDIRQEEGFKNVYLENCLGKLKSVQFMNEEDQKILIEHDGPMIFHKIIYHELLGHGCGKLLYKTDNGFNFDENLKNPLTGQNISSFYNEKDTWMSVFQNYSNPYEECRADSIALYFSCLEISTKILQPQYLGIWKKLCVAQFLNFVYAGIIGLTLYNAESKQWGQAHTQGRYVILQVLLEAGNNFVVIEKVKGDDGKLTLNIKVDHEQCLTTGKKAMEEFLLKLQVYKSTADFESGKKMFDKYSHVSEEFLEIRNIIISRKIPRRLEVQGHLEKTLDGKFEYSVFPETHEGIIQSYIKRYPYFDIEMFNLFMQYQKLNKPLL